MSYTTRDHRAHVRELQQMLRAVLPPDSGALPPVSGAFGPETARAVGEFQRLSHLEETHRVDLATWDALAASYRAHLLQLQPPGEVSPFPGRETVIYPGDQSPWLPIAQTMLRQLANRFSNLPLPELTGRWDENTQQAVRRLQQAAHLPESGQLDKATWDALAAAYNANK